MRQGAASRLRPPPLLYPPLLPFRMTILWRRVLCVAAAWHVCLTLAFATTVTGPTLYAWDYSAYLGSDTWWSSMYPSCGVPYQSPIDIETADATDATATHQVIFEPVLGKPVLSINAIIAYNSSFNTIRCDFSADLTEYYIYWQDNAPVVGKPRYRLDCLVIRFPSEHKLNGAFLPLELRYEFVPETLFPLEGSMTISDRLGTDTGVALLYWAESVSNQEEDLQSDASLDSLLRIIQLGYANGTAQVQPYFPHVRSAYQYQGTDTVPPCRANVQNFVGADILRVDASLLSRLKKFGPNWGEYRPVMPLAGRPVSMVMVDTQAMMPKLRTSPTPVHYTLQRSAPLQINPVALTFGIWCSAGICALPCVGLFCLCLQRITYTVPYSLSWRQQRRRGYREVFGVPLRYDGFTGSPLTTRGPDFSEDGLRSANALLSLSRSGRSSALEKSLPLATAVSVSDTTTE